MPAEAVSMTSLPWSGATPAAHVLCAHCALPVPPGLVDHAAPAEQQFCCTGCQTVYSVIHSCGLDRYYQLLETQGEGGRRTAKVSNRKYAEYDDPTFHTLYVRGESGGLLRTELFVENVHCSACLWLLEKLPRVLPGVLECRVALRRRAVSIAWNPEKVKLSRIAAALDSLGYPPHPVRQSATRQARKAEDRRHLVKVGIAGACAGNIMLLAFSLYAGLFDGIEPVYARIFSWLSLGFTILSLAWPGRVFFRGAIAAIRTRTLHLDLPIALGLGAGALWSAYATIMNLNGSRIAGAGGIYYDSLAMLVFALLVGRFIQHRQQRWAADSVELLFGVSPSSARLVEDGRTSDVAVESLKTGQTVEVLAGECIPVDGRVARGDSSIDQSILTGESRAVPVALGDPVAAGATNLSSTLRITVQATGADTRVGKLMRLVEDCSRRRAPIIELADRMAGWFVGGMMLLALATVVYWWSTDPARAIQYAVALLIVACPCGLGLATPLAMTVALGRAARAGLLIKGGQSLQSLATPGLMFLDKTGTLTHGRLSVVDWHGTKDEDGQDFRPLVAALERKSTHPIALALARDLSTTGADIGAIPVTEEHSTIGGGIAGVVSGQRLLIGTRAFLLANGITVTPAHESLAASAARRGLTPVFVASNSTSAAVVTLGDPIRPDAASSLRRLQSQGWEVHILSGDHPDAVAAVATELGLPPVSAQGGIQPEQKLAAISAARAASPGRTIVMVGDGVNDAAALAAATVGIAVHGGAEASLIAADVSIGREGLGALVELLDGAGSTMSAIKVNLGVSLAYNALAAALAVTGIVTPLMAAILMPASSLTVLALSFRAWRRAGAARPARSGAEARPVLQPVQTQIVPA